MDDPSPTPPTEPTPGVPGPQDRAPGELRAQAESAVVARRSARRTRLLLIGIFVALALLGAGIVVAYRGSTAESAQTERAGVAGELADAPRPGAQPGQTTTTQAPDVLPDPGVGTGECKLVTYTPTSAREKQQGELCRPKDAQRDVAVILVHGGAGIGGTYAGMKPWSNRLNTEGYVTFAIDYHLFSEGTAGPIFPWPEQNIKASVQFIRATANALGIRNNRIVVEGFSAGARLGAVAFTSPNDQYFMGNELWPFVSDEVNAYVSFYHPLDGSMQYQWQYYGGDDDSIDPSVKERWDKADSLANATNANGPAAFFTGSADWDIQITQMGQFVQALQAKNVDAAMLVVPDGGHGFDQGDGTRLSKLGEQTATGVLLFLNKEFPQAPERPAQSQPVDVVNAPNSTGLPPTSYAPRPRSTSPTSVYTNAPKYTAPSTTQRYVPPNKPYVPSTLVKPATPTTPPVTKPPVTPPPTTPAPPTTPSAGGGG